MEKLKVITVKVSSKFKRANSYDSLLAYAVAEANKKTESLYDEYKFINVIPSQTCDRCTMTEYCELIVFLSVSKPKKGVLPCKHLRKYSCDSEPTLCGRDLDSLIIPPCPYIEDPEMCEHFAEKKEDVKYAG